MAVRILLVLAALAVLYGCGREESPVGAQEAGAEASAAASEPQPLPDQPSQDATLQAYFDQMSSLMLDRGLNGPYEGGAKGHREVRTLARTRTLATLERLDPSRKRLVVLFLMEASLIQNAPGEEPVIGLVGADLSGVDLTFSAAGDAQPYASVPVADLSRDNILCLCPNHHVLLDHGSVGIREDLSLTGGEGELTGIPATRLAKSICVTEGSTTEPKSKVKVHI